VPRSKAQVEQAEAQAFAEGKHPVTEAKAEAAMEEAAKLRDEHFDPVVVPAFVELDPDHEVAIPGVESRFAGAEDSTQRKLKAAARQVETKRKAVLKEPFSENAVRPPQMARDDLIRDGKATTDEFRVAASERNQEEALEDLHLRRTHKLSDPDIAAMRSAQRAARNERAEEIVRQQRLGRRKDALETVQDRLRAEGDSIEIHEPDHVTRARHLAESQEQAESQGVRRRTPSTPEPHSERRLAPQER
jgi:hypothetical protein